jgi:hypothetical protein
MSPLSQESVDVESGGGGALADRSRRVLDIYEGLKQHESVPCDEEGDFDLNALLRGIGFVVAASSIALPTGHDSPSPADEENDGHICSRPPGQTCASWDERREHEKDSARSRYHAEATEFRAHAIASLIAEETTVVPLSHSHYYTLEDRDEAQARLRIAVNHSCSGSGVIYHQVRSFLSGLIRTLENQCGATHACAWRLCDSDISERGGPQFARAAVRALAAFSHPEDADAELNRVPTTRLWVMHDSLSDARIRELLSVLPHCCRELKGAPGSVESTHKGRTNANGANDERSPSIIGTWCAIL